MKTVLDCNAVGRGPSSARMRELGPTCIDRHVAFLPLKANAAAFSPLKKPHFELEPRAPVIELELPLLFELEPPAVLFELEPASPLLPPNSS